MYVERFYCLKEDQMLRDCEKKYAVPELKTTTAYDYYDFILVIYTIPVPRDLHNLLTL